MKLFSLVSVATLVLAYLGAVTEAVPGKQGFIDDVGKIPNQSPTDTKVRKVVQLPCNNRPDRCDMPVDWFLWLGTHNSGAVHLRDIDEDVTDPVRELEFECGYNCQDQSVTTMLQDGVRLLDMDLCGWKDKNVYLCHAMHGGQSLGLVDGYGVLYSEFLREAFRFLTTNPHQAIVLHLSDNAVNNNAYRVNLMQVDDIVDSVCKEFVPNAPKGACPLIHIQPPAPQAWPTLKQLVSLDDKNAKIKSRAIITNSGDFHAPDGYQTKYISPMFWQNSWFEDQSTSTIEPHLNQMCKNSISIGYEAILGYKFPRCIRDLARKINNPSYLNESIFAPQGCNIRATPTQTRISMLMVDFYQTHFAWIKDTLQSQLLEINWNKYKQTIVKPKKGKGKKGGN